MALDSTSGREAPEHEDSVKTSFWQNLFFIALLGSSTVLLPACGGNAVKSSDNSTPMMNAESTPDTSAQSSSSASTVPENSYVEKSSSKSKSSAVKAPVSTVPLASAPTPLPTQDISSATPVAEPAAVPQKSGSHFLWWLLLILILAGIGWYFWSKNHSDEDEFQPHPPSGGLSPVSGYTGTKHLEADEKKAPSIWTRKLF